MVNQHHTTLDGSREAESQRSDWVQLVVEELHSGGLRDALRRTPQKLPDVVNVSRDVFYFWIHCTTEGTANG